MASTDRAPRQAPPSSALIAWFAEIGSQVPRDATAPRVGLPPTCRVSETGGRDQCTIAWDPVDGAAGYLVHRMDTTVVLLLPIGNGRDDVFAVFLVPFVATKLEPGR